jgi:DNA-binding transcriptional ArsR family regulator
MAARSVKDVIAGGKLKTFIDRRLIKALSHPLREHVLAVLNERVASTSEIGREIDLDVPAFYHHVEVLEELGFLERVESKRRRGAKEHFFRAKATMLFDDRAWERVPVSIRSDLAGSYIWAIMQDVVRALRGGAFGANPATHTTWLPGIFDRLGWQECLALMNETLARAMEIQRRSGERIAVTGEAGIPATIAIVGFRTPPETRGSA